jgi:hypothetical protein
MKQVERYQFNQSQLGFKTIQANHGLPRHQSLICEGILVGDLKQTSKADTGDDEALAKGETRS